MSKVFRRCRWKVQLGEFRLQMEKHSRYRKWHGVNRSLSKQSLFRLVQCRRVSVRNQCVYTADRWSKRSSFTSVHEMILSHLQWTPSQRRDWHHSDVTGRPNNGVRMGGLVGALRWRHTHTVPSCTAPARVHLKASISASPLPRRHCPAARDVADKRSPSNECSLWTILPSVRPYVRLSVHAVGGDADWPQEWDIDRCMTGIRHNESCSSVRPSNVPATRTHTHPAGIVWPMIVNRFLPTDRRNRTRLTRDARVGGWPRRGCDVRHQDRPSLLAMSVIRQTMNSCVISTHWLRAVCGVVPSSWLLTVSISRRWQRAAKLSIVSYVHSFWKRCQMLPSVTVALVFHCRHVCHTHHHSFK